MANTIGLLQLVFHQSCTTTGQWIGRGVGDGGLLYVTKTIILMVPGKRCGKGLIYCIYMLNQNEMNLTLTVQSICRSLLQGERLFSGVLGALGIGTSPLSSLAPGPSSLTLSA